jgi:hypothetical protein
MKSILLQTSRNRLKRAGGKEKKYKLDTIEQKNTIKMEGCQCFYIPPLHAPPVPAQTLLLAPPPRCCSTTYSRTITEILF